MEKNGDIGWILSILAGYLPSGIAFGALSTAVHVPWYFTIALSIVVYSGAVQSAFIGFWSLGFDPVSLILTAFLLNLRHTFYGPHLEEHYSNVRMRDILTIGPFVTDEVYAIGIGTRGMTISKLRVVSIFSYTLWIMGTMLGIALTGGIPSFILPILYLALPSLFLGLMMPKLRGGPTSSAAAASIVVSILFKLYGLPAYFILASIVVGVSAGLVAMAPSKEVVK